MNMIIEIYIWVVNDQVYGIVIGCLFIGFLFVVFLYVQKFVLKGQFFWLIFIFVISWQVLEDVMIDVVVFDIYVQCFGDDDVVVVFDFDVYIEMFDFFFSEC